jgi:hypothetical protein
VTPVQHGRWHLRVPLNTEATIAWGYQSRRCAISEFSTHGLTVKGLDARVGMPVSIGLPMPDGVFTLCGVVVHRSGANGAVGIRFVDLPSMLQVDLDLYLWSLLAAESLPADEKTCSIVGCGRPRKARGLCSSHYSRWRRQQSRGEAGDESSNDFARGERSRTEPPK